jgi:hypothetical protein
MFLLVSPRASPPKDKIKTEFPSFNQDYPPPVGQTGVFELSQDYPETFDTTEKPPWATINFKTQYKEYMQAVLRYCLEGNVDSDFIAQNNKIRKWYHAPWLHYGLNGREYHHGLTRERPVPIHELHTSQDVWLENWAIGFYNAPGGVTIDKVWQTDSTPDLKLADFSEGTVSFKLLFTAGSVDKVPFLKGTKEWTANIYPCNPDIGTPDEKAACKSKRVDSTVRLLQVDIAVKDKNAAETGWVFGTFVYDGSQPGSDVWAKLVPVGLMWGDDSKADTLINKEGSFINPDLRQTALNPYLIFKPGTDYGAQAYMSHHGLGGRLNGPVDNPISSCISCHSKAAITNKGLAAPMGAFGLTRKTFTKQAFEKYFSTIKGESGELKIDATTYNKLDYSLQFTAGVRNFYQAKIDEKKKSLRLHNIPDTIQDLPEVTRNGLISK